jgi:hypothetical protein
VAYCSCLSVIARWRSRTKNRHPHCRHPKMNMHLHPKIPWTSRKERIRTRILTVLRCYKISPLTMMTPRRNPIQSFQSSAGLDFSVAAFRTVDDILLLTIREDGFVGCSNGDSTGVQVIRKIEASKDGCKVRRALLGTQPSQDSLSPGRRHVPAAQVQFLVSNATPLPIHIKVRATLSFGAGG